MLIYSGAGYFLNVTSSMSSSMGSPSASPRIHYRHMNRKRLLRIGVVIVFLFVAIISVWCIPTGKAFISVVVWRIRGRTGTLYSILPNGDMLTSHYKHGPSYYPWPFRDGIWTITDKSGRVIATSEYRDDEPWNGICWIFEGKAWIGEYKDGKPWHGCLPIEDANHKNEWKYFIKGKEVSYDEYCKEWGLKGPGYEFVGLGRFTDTSSVTPKTPPASPDQSPPPQLPS